MNWSLPPEIISLRQKTVDVWSLSLLQNPDLLAECRTWLSPDELERAGRFLKEEHHHRFILGRGGLRKILSRYQGVHPAGISFQYSSHGKPSLVDRDNSERLSFNLSHSKDLAIAAVAWDRLVGIDVEYMRENLDFLKLAGRFFAKNEAEALLNVSLNQRKETFFRIWTRKEAYIKAHGKGLSLPLDQFEVSTGPEKIPLLLHTLHDPMDKDKWSLSGINTWEGYLCTLACEGVIGTIRFWKGP